MVDVVYGWPSLSGVVDRSEQTPLRALKQEGMDSLEPSPSEFPAIISDVASIIHPWL